MPFGFETFSAVSTFAKTKNRVDGGDGAENSERMIVGGECREPCETGRSLKVVRHECAGQYAHR